jgi:serine/threonine protein kinase
MPEISRFLGIVIGMFFNEHGVPHFHAVYGEHEATIEIESERVHGHLPRRVLALVAAGFAYMAASVVYGLGREVVAARELGSYQLVERLGEGGMGEVWRARHHMLARPAAIKLIRPVLVDGAPQPVTEHMVARFEREAQALASLRSPHTVDLFDFGVADDGSFYYAMELLEGLDTEVLVRRFGPVPAERTIHVLRQVCHSLSEAEARGLVHRDIKPANIFLCRYGEDYDFVKVLDFGIVKSTHGGGMRTPALTRETTVAGSVPVLPPLPLIVVALIVLPVYGVAYFSLASLFGVENARALIAQVLARFRIR